MRVSALEAKALHWARSQRECPLRKKDVLLICKTFEL
jgi:hypothetical protein